MADIGYARVSTLDQNPQLQIDALTQVGCDPIFVDHASGARADRPELIRALDYLRKDDTLVVWRLDRLGRNLAHLLDISENLRRREINLRLLDINVDTNTPTGWLILAILGAIAQFNRFIIRENAQAGRDSARARGLKGGRPPKLTKRQAQLARDMYAEVDDNGRRRYTVAEIAAELKVGRTTIYDYLKQERAS